MARDGIDEVGVWREGMLYLTNTLSGVGEVYQTAFYGLPSDVSVVGVWREGMLYLTNTLSGVGELYQTAFYGLPSDVSVVGVWRALSADHAFRHARHFPSSAFAATIHGYEKVCALKGVCRDRLQWQSGCLVCAWTHRCRKHH